MSKGSKPVAEHVEVAVVGAGIAGLYALYKLRALGFKTVAIEAGSGVGGTWYWNRYPGARCDVESFQYSYSFSSEVEQEWHWTERFAAQPEILAYLEHIADRFDLRRDIRLDTRVVSARYSEGDQRWSLETEAGDTFIAQFCVMATGVLSKPREIAFPGQETFGGTILSTANWPDAPPDLDGKRIALIGTGASGSQAMPHLLEQAAALTVFQRTPNFSIPTANSKVDEAYERHWKDNYPALRQQQFATSIACLFDLNDKPALDATPEERRAEFERRWSEDGGLNFMRAFNDLSNDERANSLAAEFVREKIRTIVKDPETARKLTPPNYPIDARRLATTDGDFYDFFNRPNVTLVSMIEEPITAITATGVVTSEREHPADVIVMATGFDAMTGALASIDLLGVGHASLRDRWAERPGSYLGIAVPGFPNLFMINGPGATGPLANLFTSSEMLGDWIGDCLTYLRAEGVAEISIDEASEARWMAHVQEIGEQTLMIKAPSSSYFVLGPAREKIFLCYAGGYAQFRTELDAVASAGYAPFRLRRSAVGAENEANARRSADSTA